MIFVLRLILIAPFVLVFVLAFFFAMLPQEVRSKQATDAAAA
jgi:hypothetical protein